MSYVCSVHLGVTKGTYEGILYMRVFLITKVISSYVHEI